MGRLWFAHGFKVLAHGLPVGDSWFTLDLTVLDHGFVLLRYGLLMSCPWVCNAGA